MKKAPRWKNASEAVPARPYRLRDGSWGAVANTFVRVGDPVLIETKSSKSWFATADKIIYRNNDTTIVTTKKEKSEKEKRKDYERHISCLKLGAALREIAIALHVEKHGEKEGKKSYRREARLLGDRGHLLTTIEDDLDHRGEDDATDAVCDAHEAYKRGDSAETRRLLLVAAEASSDKNFLEKAAERF